MIKGLIEDTLFSTQPAMVLNLKTCASSPPVRKNILSATSCNKRKQIYNWIKNDGTFTLHHSSSHSQAATDHLSVRLNSLNQNVSVKRLMLRQLRATLNKGRTCVFVPEHRLISARLPADSRGLTVWLSLRRSLVQIRGAVLCPQPGPTLHREGDMLPACAQ